jgi:hypothetical protein
VTRDAKVLLIAGAVAIALCVLLFVPLGRPRARVPAHVYAFNERDQRLAFGKVVKHLLASQRFDALEQLADSLERHSVAWPSGRPKLTTFYDLGFGEVDVASDPEAWATLLAELREWVDARPQSATARIALANALEARAWAARGPRIAVTVSEEGWRRFHSDVGEALGYLKQCPETALGSPEWHRAFMAVLHDMGTEADSAYRAEAAHALRSFPGHAPLYAHFAYHLLPRWYGEKGELERFADESTRALPDSIADEFYARVVLSVVPYHANGLRDLPGLSWERTVRGLDDWHRRWPRSAQPRSALALLAWQKRDRESARRAFAALGDTVEMEIWEDGSDYWAARNWSESVGR